MDTRMQAHNVLIVPGWYNSGPDHWQSLWQAESGYTRVEQHDWERPLRGDWMSQLEEAVLATTCLLYTSPSPRDS